MSCKVILGFFTVVALFSESYAAGIAMIKSNQLSDDKFAKAVIFSKIHDNPQAPFVKLTVGSVDQNITKALIAAYVEIKPLPQNIGKPSEFKQLESERDRLVNFKDRFPQAGEIVIPYINNFTESLKRIEQGEKRVAGKWLTQKESDRMAEKLTKPLPDNDKEKPNSSVSNMKPVFEGGDLVLLNGKVLKNTKLKSVERDFISVLHSGGVDKVAISSLPSDVAAGFSGLFPEIAYHQWPGKLVELGFGSSTTAMKILSNYWETENKKVVAEVDFYTPTSFKTYPLVEWIFPLDKIGYSDDNVFNFIVKAKVEKLPYGGGVVVKPVEPFSVGKKVTIDLGALSWNSDGYVGKNAIVGEIEVNRFSSITAKISLDNSKFVYDNFVKNFEGFVFRDPSQELRNAIAPVSNHIFVSYSFQGFNGLRAETNLVNPTVSNPTEYWTTTIDVKANLLSAGVVIDAELAGKKVWDDIAQAKTPYSISLNPTDRSNGTDLRALAWINLIDKVAE